MVIRTVELVGLMLVKEFRKSASMNSILILIQYKTGATSNASQMSVRPTYVVTMSILAQTLLQRGFKKVSHYQVSSLNRIKNRH